MRRRDMMTSCALLLLLAAGSGPPAVARARDDDGWGEDGLGLQLYALDPDLRRDLPATLAQVARLGVRTVELASMHGRSAAEMRAALDRAGLRCRSVHVAATATVPGADGLNFDDVGRLADELSILGARDAVLPLFQAPKRPGWGEPIPLAALARPGGVPVPADRYERMADFLNETGAILKRRGIAIGYHNHNFELAPLGKGSGLQILLDRTDPRIVRFEMDTGWLSAAGQDPIEWLRRYPRRFSQMHVKDLKASTPVNFHLRQEPAEVGAGRLDWPAILAAARQARVGRYFVEQDPPFAGPRIDAIARSLTYLRVLSRRTA